MTRPAIDETGNVHGKLVVVGRATDAPAHHAFWLCACECGNNVEVSGSYLRAGKKHCGCVRVVRPSGNGAGRQVRIPEYGVWQQMIQRCENPRNLNYGAYGGRNIRVSPAWHSFDQFIADMGRRPSPKHSLDRIDNNGHYEPGNVRWATWIEQRANRRKVSHTRPITQTEVVEAYAMYLAGFTFDEVVRHFGFSSISAIMQRFKRMGWPTGYAVRPHALVKARRAQQASVDSNDRCDARVA